MVELNVGECSSHSDLRKSDQIAFYDDGVGTSAFLPLALLGGAFGWFLKRNVIELYKFVCRNYRSKEQNEDVARWRTLDAIGLVTAASYSEPEKDDEIYGSWISAAAHSLFAC